MAYAVVGPYYRQHRRYHNVRRTWRWDNVLTAVRSLIIRCTSIHFSVHCAKRLALSEGASPGPQPYYCMRNSSKHWHRFKGLCNRDSRKKGHGYFTSHRCPVIFCTQQVETLWTGIAFSCVSGFFNGCAGANWTEFIWSPITAWPTLSGNRAASLFLNNTTIQRSDKNATVDAWISMSPRENITIYSLPKQKKSPCRHVA